jgi:hypothetical protein
MERAAAKDTKESLDQLQPDCPDDLFEKLCPQGQPPSAQCLELCGDELDDRG